MEQLTDIEKELQKQNSDKKHNELINKWGAVLIVWCVIYFTGWGYDIEAWIKSLF